MFSICTTVKGIDNIYNDYMAVRDILKPQYREPDEAVDNIVICDRLPEPTEGMPYQLPYELLYVCHLYQAIASPLLLWGNDDLGFDEERTYHIIPIDGGLIVTDELDYGDTVTSYDLIPTVESLLIIE